MERANLNRQRVRPKAEGIKATLSRASKWGKKKFSNSPAASTLKRNQLIRGSPLENISTDRVKRVRVRDGPLPVKKPKQPGTIGQRLTRRRFKPTQQLLMLNTFFAAPHIFLLRLYLSVENGYIIEGDLIFFFTTHIALREQRVVFYAFFYNRV